MVEWRVSIVTPETSRFILEGKSEKENSYQLNVLSDGLMYLLVCKSRFDLFSPLQFLRIDI